MSTKNKFIGEKIKEAVKSAGIKMYELASKISIDRSALSLYVNGHREPPVSVLQRIATETNMPLPWFIEEKKSVVVNENNKEQSEIESIKARLDKIENVLKSKLWDMAGEK